MMFNDELGIMSRQAHMVVYYSSGCSDDGLLNEMIEYKRLIRLYCIIVLCCLFISLITVAS